MPHILTLTIKPRDGITPVLECTEPDDAPCRAARPFDKRYCSTVEMFGWDSAAALEGYYGGAFDAFKAAIKVTAANEDEFDWELAGEEVM